MNLFKIVLSAFLFSFSFAIQSMDSSIVNTVEIKQKKLYAEDFKLLGVNYLDHLVYIWDVDNSENKAEGNSEAREYHFLREYYLSYSKSISELHWIQEANLKYSELIKQRSRPKLYLQFISEEVGYGVFADEDIDEGQFIQEYTGLVLGNRDLGKNDRFKSDYLLHLCGRDYNQLTIDAEKSGNFTRFINHSYKPNVVTLECTVDGALRIIVTANQHIKRGQQLKLNYEFAYWWVRNIVPIDL